MTAPEAAPFALNSAANSVAPTPDRLLWTWRKSASGLFRLSLPIAVWSCRIRCWDWSFKHSNEAIDFETASIIVGEHGYQAERNSA
jgi:hypothetical protein